MTEPQEEVAPCNDNGTKGSNGITFSPVSKTASTVENQQEEVALHEDNSANDFNTEEAVPTSECLPQSTKSTAVSEKDGEHKRTETAPLNHLPELAVSDSGVVAENTSDDEEQPEDKDSELDLSGILADLSPIPQPTADDPLRDSANILPISGDKPCNLGQNDDLSHEGSEDESPAIPYEPPGDVTYEQTDQPSGGAEVDDLPNAPADPPNAPLLEPLTPDEVTEDTQHVGYPSQPVPAAYSSEPSARSILNYDSPTSQYLIDGSAGGSGVALQPFQQPTFNPPQSLQGGRPDEVCNVMGREPTNDERIAFLRSCSTAVLWHFVLNCLSQPIRYGKVCAWTSSAWEWRITHTKRFTEKWDECNMNKQAASYVKVSRALKSFESTKFRGLTLLKRVASGRNAFRFLPDHHSPHIPFGEHPPDVPFLPAQCALPQQSTYPSPTLSSLLSHDQTKDEAMESGHYSHFGAPSQLRLPSKRAIYVSPTEENTSRSVKNSRIDRTPSQFPVQMYTSTPVRNGMSPASFGRDITNTDVWASPYVSFSPVSTPITAQSQWPNYTPSVYQSNYPMWTYPGCPMPYQFADSNNVSSGYTGFPNRDAMGWVASTPPMYVNQYEFGSVNSSNDSGICEGSRSMLASCHSTPYPAPFNGDGRRPQLDRGIPFGGNIYP